MRAVISKSDIFRKKAFRICKLIPSFLTANNKCPCHVSGGQSLAGTNSSSPADNVNFGPTDNVSGIIGNGVFNDDVDISYENAGYEGKTYERPSSNEKPYVTTKDKMIYNSPNAI